MEAVRTSDGQILPSGRRLYSVRHEDSNADICLDDSVLGACSKYFMTLQHHARPQRIDIYFSRRLVSMGEAKEVFSQAAVAMPGTEVSLHMVGDPGRYMYIGLQ